MQEKTTHDRLMKRTVDQLADALVRLGIEPPERGARKAEWAQRLVEALPGRMMNILLQMREAEYMALSRWVQEEQKITIAQAQLDDPLENALTVLERYGQAWRTTSYWQLSCEAQELMLPDAELLEDLKLHDVISDEMEGWLIHVGMMPVERLLERVSDAPGLPEEHRQRISDLAFALLMARRGMDALYPDPDAERLWAVCEDLDEPEKLHARVTSPTVAALPYPSLSVDELIGCVRGGGLPGEKQAYQPLAEWMVINRPSISGQECMDVMDAAVYMLQNGDFDEMVYFLMDTVEPKGEKNIREGEEAIMHFVNHIPLWDNKGHSASAMARMLKAPGKQKMPGRNDPCPCGSGKKYKQCCGRLVN